ncbi:MAG: C10 family peptidase [Muribaculaceae bacterium]|nr:C10 family peptidase [Muribaculaceae bacterium]
MKKICFALFAIVALASQGATVSEQEAAERAAQFFGSHQVTAASRPSLALRAKKASAAAAPAYYVFNNSAAAGWVVIAGDDKAPVVLAYGDEGAIDPANVPDGMEYMLGVYSDEITALRDNPALAAPPARAVRDKTVAPLLKTTWNQSEPYNNLCPTYTADGTTERSATGCVITATAQIMNYYRWPEQGVGSHSYECNVNETSPQTLSADFGNTTYRWDDMLNDYENGNYTDRQADAVATLMYHIGVAAGTNYGGNSGVDIFNMMEAIRDHFGYNKAMRNYSRYSMTGTEWEALIDNELDNSHPVLFAGYVRSGGSHAFVIDGYDTRGYYHINWGWGGTSNGYFLITALSPGVQGIGSFEGGYNSLQGLITGLYPDCGEPAPEKGMELCVENFKPSVNSFPTGSLMPMIINSVRVVGYGCGPTLNVTLRFDLCDEEGNQVGQQYDTNSYTTDYTMGQYLSFIEPNVLYANTTFMASPDVADGVYRLWLMYKCPEAGVNDFREYDHSATLPGYIEVTVKDGVVYYNEESAPANLAVPVIDCPEQVGTDSQMKVTSTIRNNGSYYEGVVKYSYQPKDMSVEPTIIEGEYVTIAPGKDVIMTAQIPAPATAGEYYLRVLDKNNKVIGGDFDFSVLLSKDYNLEITSQITPDAYIMPSGQVSGMVELTNTGSGTFVGNIPYKIMSDDLTFMAELGISDIVTIAPGEKVKVSIASAFEGVPGKVYRMCLRFVADNSDWGDNSPFKIAALPTAVSAVNADAVTVRAGNGTISVSGASSVAVYDSRGTLIATGSEARALAAGLYIVVADGISRKVLLR